MGPGAHPSPRKTRSAVTGGKACSATSYLTAVPVMWASTMTRALLFQVPSHKFRVCAESQSELSGQAPRWQPGPAPSRPASGRALCRAGTPPSPTGWARSPSLRRPLRVDVPSDVPSELPGGLVIGTGRAGPVPSRPDPILPQQPGAPAKRAGQPASAGEGARPPEPDGT